MDPEVGFGHVEVRQGVLFLFVVFGVPNGFVQHLFIFPVHMPHQQLVELTFFDEDGLFLFVLTDLAKGRRDRHGAKDAKQQGEGHPRGA